MIRIENADGAITITNEVFTVLAGDAATSCFGTKATSLLQCDIDFLHH